MGLWSVWKPVGMPSNLDVSILGGMQFLELFY